MQKEDNKFVLDGSYKILLAYHKYGVYGEWETEMFNFGFQISVETDMNVMTNRFYLINLFDKIFYYLSNIMQNVLSFSLEAPYPV